MDKCRVNIALIILTVVLGVGFFAMNVAQFEYLADKLIKEQNIHGQYAQE